jgi:NAD-dependent deacetylase
MPLAYKLAEQADIFMVIGTSLQVYPAASLISDVRMNAPVYIIDKKIPLVRRRPKQYLIEEPGTTGVPKVVEQLLKEID